MITRTVASLLALALVCSAAGPARGLDEGLHASAADVKVSAKIEGQSFTFSLDVNAAAAKDGGELPLAAGDVGLDELVEPKAGAAVKYDAKRRTYSLAFAKAGVQKVSATFAARAAAVQSGAWREAIVDLPPARLRSIEIVCDRADLEVQLPGALRLQRNVAGDKLTLTALLAPGAPMTVRWKPAVQALDAKLVFASEANTIATVSTGLLKLDTIYDFSVSQGQVSELIFMVPAALSVTQVRGSFIRDWKLNPPAAGAPAGSPGTLVVNLNRPQTGRYGLQVLGETTLPALPAQVSLPVIEPQGGIRAGGSLCVGTNSAIALVLKQTGGLSQINGAAFPRIGNDTRAVPESKAFFFTHAATPYQMSLALADIVPVIDAMQNIVVGVSDENLTVAGSIDLEVREAPVRELQLEVPATLEVAEITGAHVDGGTPRPIVAGQATRLVDIRFKQPVLGRTLVKYKLQLNKSPLAAAHAIASISVRGANIKRSFIVVAVEPDQGVAVDPPAVQGLTEMNTASTQQRVVGTEFAYSFNNAAWSLTVAPRKRPATIRVESFHLLTLADGVAYGTIALSYFITGAPVDELSFRIPPAYRNVEFVGRDRAWRADEKDKQIYHLKLSRKAIDVHTQTITFTVPYKAGEELEFGGILCDGVSVQTQTGYLAVASHLNLNVTPATVTGSDARVIDPGDLPRDLALLVNAPILHTFAFTKPPHTVKLKVDAFERQSLLPVVIEVTDIRTDVFARKDEPTESRTTVRYKIKNAASQFLPLLMPAEDVTVWRVRAGVTVIENNRLVDKLEPAKTSMDPKNKQLLMITLPRTKNPNEPVTIEVEYGKLHGELGFSGHIALAAPTTPTADTKQGINSTFTTWSIRTPAEWSVHLAEANLLPSARTIRHGSLGQVMNSVAASWAWGWSEWRAAFSERATQLQGQIVIGTLLIALISAALVIFAALRSRTALRLAFGAIAVMALTGLGTLAAQAPPLSEEFRADDALSTLTLTQTVTANSSEPLTLEAGIIPQWRQHATFFGGFFLPIACILLILAAALAKAIPTLSRLVPYRFPAVVIGIVGVLYGAAQFNALEGVLLHVFTWLLPTLVLVSFVWRAVGRAAFGLNASPSRAGAVAAAITCVVLPMLTGTAARADGVLSLAPKEPTLQRLEAALKADGDHVEVDLSIRVSADHPSRAVFLDHAPILLTPDQADAPVRLELQGKSYHLVVSKPGVHDVTFKFLSALPKAGEDQSRAFFFALPQALSKRVKLTVPAVGQDVEVAGALRMTRAEANGATTASALLGPSDHAAVAWKPRARETSQEKTVFYSQSTSLARFDASLVEVQHLVRFQIAQGELRQIRIRVPEPMTVTVVKGKSIGAWRYDIPKQELEVRLSEPAVGEYSLVVVTQISREKLPYDATIGAISVADAARHSGVLGFTASPAVQIVVQKAPATMNVDDFAREAGVQSAVRNAFRMDKADDSVTAQVVEVKPELHTEESVTFVIADEQLLYNSDVKVDVTKAGVFAVELKLPAAYEIDVLTAPQVSHWDESIANEIRTVTVHLREKHLGSIPLKIQLTRTVQGLPGQITVPRVQVTGVTKTSGRLIVKSDKGVILSVGERTGVNDVDPLEFGIREPGVLCFKLPQPDWSLTLATEVIKPRITADFLHVADVVEGIVRHTQYLSYRLHNAGSKVFEIQLPRGAEAVQILGRDIARKNEVEKGSGRWRIELNRKWFEGRYSLEVRYETKYALTVAGAGMITLEPIKATGVERQAGYLVVLPAPRVQLALSGGAGAMQAMDPRTIPRLFTSRSFESAAFSRSTAAADYSVTLSAQRHEAANLLQADALGTLIKSVVADTGHTLTSVRIDLRVHSKQHLEVMLPPDSELWAVQVNGKSPVPSRTTKNGARVELIPLGAAAREGADVTVEFTYVSPPPADWSSTQPKLIGPRFDLPLKDVNWILYLPEQFDYREFEGTLTINRDFVMARKIEVFNIETYTRNMYHFNQANTNWAQEQQHRGEDYLRKGDQKRAQQALEAAVHYSASNAAFNEDARVKLTEFNNDLALMGLLGSRDRLRQQEGAGAGAMALELLNAEAIQKAKVSLGKEETDHIAEQTRAWTDMQAKAAGETVALAVALPQRGRVLEFNRSVQVQSNAPMELQFDAEAETPEAKVASRWWAAGLLAMIALALWLVPVVLRRVPDATDAFAKREVAVPTDAVIPPQ